MSEFAIGIDLGTSTSEVAVYRKEKYEIIPDPGTKVPIIPSIISVNKRGKLLVGEEAKEYPDNIVREVKRKMGSGETILLAGKEYRPEELSALILSKIKHNAETYLGENIANVVLSVPANFNDAAKQATINAAELAGLNVVNLINEPTAAALAFGINNIETETQAVVFDFGGGTLDITVLEMMEGILDVKSSYGDPKLGGKDFDEALIELIKRKFFNMHGESPINEKSLAALKSNAEKAKISLSENDSYEVNIPYFTIINGNITDLEVEITRAEFEDAVKPLLARAEECLKRAMKSGNLRPSSIDKILMVGGTTYIPCVQNLVSSFFAKELKREVDPDLAVCIGASIKAGMMAEMVDPRENIILADVCPMGIGIDVISEIGEQLMLTYHSLIKSNTKAPFSKQYPLSLVTPDQREVHFSIYQTYITDDIFPLEIGLSKGIIEEVGLSSTISDIPPALYGTPHPINIDFSYDENGIVKLYAEIPGIQKNTSIDFSHSKFRMNDSEKEEGIRRVEELLRNSDLTFSNTADEVPANEYSWQSNPAAYKYMTLIQKAEKMADESISSAPHLLQALSGLKNALSIGDETKIKEAGNKLADIIFEIQN